ncbi:hypothetical protein FRC01_011836, partial [Tulasnella sp. 417]
MLKVMKSKGADKIPGFYGLRTEDRARVTADINAGRIGASTKATAASASASSTPATGRTLSASASSATAQAPSASNTDATKKRKEPSTEEPQASSSSSRAPPATQIVAEEDLDAANDEPAYEADEVYVPFPTKIVGVRYYTGMVGAGELVSVVREPTNQYDP